jgi:hypothetical protein
LSFITPLGTNGIDSHLIANKVSLNILGGYSYGNRYFELGSLYNVNLHFTEGFAAAGLFNYSGNTKNAVQLAGLLNASMDGNAGAQIGGIANIAKESTFQLGGISNITTGITGSQISGIVNIAKESTFQLGGISNISLGTTGTQISPILNIAKEVNGLQFGLINYAEDMNGVPIGLISFVKNSKGKPEFEIGFSDSLNTFISFKFGINKFYTIFSGGINYINNPTLMAYGFGFGTHMDWADGWGSQIELVGYHIFKDEKYHWDSNGDDLSLLNQLKIKGSKQFNDYFKVSFGPVFNLTIRRGDREDLSLWSMRERTGKTKLKSWVGFEVGGGVSLH